MKKIALIGSTGSIGCQVLNVVRRNPDKFKIISLAGGNNAGLFIRQIEEFKPEIATLCTEMNREYSVPEETKLYQGEKSAFLNAITEDADIVVVSLVGYLGLTAVLKAIELKKDIALANKESLVVGGEIVMKRARENGVKILPIDSEHSAIWQALDFDFNKPFNKIILTASGGALRDLTKTQMAKAKVKDVLKHPTWNMGSKITVDCATMVNKAFEVAEAHWLYNASFDKIEVILHRESIIHSMVEYADSSVIAQMSYPSMELPIQIALSYPERFESGLNSLKFAEIGKLTFSEVDEEKYNSFKVAREAIEKGGLYPTVLNSANERAVSAFLNNEAGFSFIFKAIDQSLNAFKNNGKVTEESIQEAHKFGTIFVEKLLKKKDV